MPVTELPPRAAAKLNVDRPMAAAAPVRWPVGGVAEVRVAAGVPGRAAGLPVTIGAAESTRAAGFATPARVRVRLLDQRAVRRAGVIGLLLELSRADGVSTPGRITLGIDYASFRGAAGGDWASRLMLARLDCSAPCRPAVLPARNDIPSGRLTATVAIGQRPVTFALAAGSSGPSGDYTATSLSPSASWQVNQQSGDFTWSYPLRVPPVPGGLAPSLSLGYSSGSVDGRTAATNNQPSWVGDGWELSPGFVERRYRSCVDDEAQTSDLCWGPESLSLVYGGHSTELVRDDTNGTFHARSDDGSKVERLTNKSNGVTGGEAWKVTTLDGTQYFFGLNQLPGWSAGKPVTNSAWTVPVFGNHADEPCHAAAFDASSCAQAWRWNLDYVVDPHANAIAYFYAKETNNYGLNGNRRGVQYVRGGYLTSATYGFQDLQAYGIPGARVVFETAERCITAGSTCVPTTANAGNFPDVPVDQICTSSPCTVTQTAPTFWSTKKLVRITSQVWKGSAYSGVDQWALGQTFPLTGDPVPAGAPPAASLWLRSIQRSGLVGGSANTPAMTFDGVTMPNRVDGLEGWPPLNRYRVATIRTETGGQFDVNYAPAECVRTALPAAQDTNTKRCFPAWWTPPGEPLQLDWFHKYVVAQVLAKDVATGGPAVQTDYAYDGGGAWHYTDSDEITPLAKRTWSQWRGYRSVTVTTGAPEDTRLQTSYLYLRGMHGDKLSSGTRSITVTDSQGDAVTDSAGLEGFLREQITLDGVDGTEVSGQINDPWQSAAMATHAHDGLTVTARMVDTGGEHGRVRLPSGEDRRTLLTRSFDGHGQPTVVDDRGDETVTVDDLCTRTGYAANNTRWMFAYPSRIATVAVRCANTPSYPDDAVSDVRTFYDLSTTLGELPATGAGDATRTEQVASYASGNPVYAQASTATYDDFGRVLTAKDQLNRPTTTVYTDTGGLTTQTVVTNAAGHATTTTIEPARGLPTAVVDPNSQRVDLSYDPLGRLTEVWKPSRPKASGYEASLKFGYLVRNNGATAVSTAAIGPNAAYLPSYTLYDGLLRPRQTQASAVGGGRVLTDTGYDSRGLAVKSNGPYVTTGSPGTTFAAVDSNQVPSQTLTEYDGAGRPVASIFQSFGDEQWRTTTSYGGDHVDVRPPDGGTPTSTYVDARGRTTELRQYHGADPSDGYDSTGYDHTPAGQLARITDPAGNAWQYRYDLRGRNTEIDDPDRGRSTMTYDNAGQLLTTTDARDRKLAYSYDALGRKTGEYEGSTTGPQAAGWVYDTLRKGSLTSATRYVDGQEYVSAISGYTEDGLPWGSSVTIPDTGDGLAGTYSYRMQYRPDGNMHVLTLPATPGLPNERLTYQYDDLGHPSVLESGQPVGIVPFVPAALYTPLGAPARLTLRSGSPTAWLSYYYEESTQRLSRTLVETGGNPVPAADTRYDHDPSGNVTKVSTTVQGGPTDVQCFDYDHVRRLVEAWTPTDDCADEPAAAQFGGPVPYWQSYRYDATGNRTRDIRHSVTGGSDDVTNYFYPPAGQPQPHTVSSISGPSGRPSGSFAYDAAGNTTSRPVTGGSQTLTYDIEGHLATTTGAGTSTSYVYDADGARLIRRDASGSTLYLPYDVEVHADPAGQKTSTRYYQFAGITIAVRTAAGLFFLGSDPHSTSTHTVAASNAAVTTRRFDPFGIPRGTPAAAWPGEHGYVGGTTDPTGLTHLGAREYDPTLGRFTSVDPLLDPADPQQLNGYAYANNSPVTNADPTGELLCGGPDGIQCNYYGYGKEGPGGGGSGKGGGGTSYRHGPDVTTTITARHAYINGIQLPDSAPDSAKLADLVAKRIPDYKDDAAGHYMGGEDEFSYKDIIAIIAQVCKHEPGACSNEFSGWATSATLAVSPAMVRGYVLVQGGPEAAALGGAFIITGVVKVAARLPRFEVNAAGEATLLVHRGAETLRVTEHATLRMTQRRVSPEAVEQALRSPSFRYYHDGVWKDGYHDVANRVFVGVHDGRVITVINRVTENYVNNLRGLTP